MKKNLKCYRFSKSVKDTVFIKAGGKCSYTNCLVNLVSDERNYQIAHIYPSADDGPRSEYLIKDAVTGSFRESAENGILMCPTHASKIDKRACVNDFPPRILFEMKSIRELTNRLITTNENIKTYARILSDLTITSVVRQKYLENKTSVFLNLDFVIEEELRNLYKDTYSSQHKNDVNTFQIRALTSLVKKAISGDRECLSYQDEINHNAANTLLSIIKNIYPVARDHIYYSLPSALLDIETRYQLNLVITLNGKAYKFQNLRYRTFILNRNLFFDLQAEIPFLNVKLTIFNGAVEEIICDVSTQIGSFSNALLVDNLETVCELLQEANSSKINTTPTVTLEFDATDIKASFIFNDDTSFEVPTSFIASAKEILHCTNTYSAQLFNEQLYMRLLNNLLSPKEFRQIYDFFYRKLDEPDEERYEFENYTCVLNKSLHGVHYPEKLKVLEIPAHTNSTQNSIQPKPVLQITI